MDTKKLATKIDTLPPESRYIVIELVSMLSQFHQKQNLGKPDAPKFGWIGGLKDVCPDVSSMELQHEASENR